MTYLERSKSYKIDARFKIDYKLKDLLRIKGTKVAECKSGDFSLHHYILIEGKKYTVYFETEAKGQDIHELILIKYNTWLKNDKQSMIDILLSFIGYYEDKKLWSEHDEVDYYDESICVISKMLNKLRGY